MTTLSRQTQKVFASNADADQIAVFGSMKTGTPVYSTNLATLQSTAYTEGWSEALLADKAPYLEEMNAVQYGLSYQIAYLLQEGAPEYDASTNYSDTSIVKVIDSNGLSFYRSLVEDNLGNSLSDTDYWALIPLANVQPQLALKANVDLSNCTQPYITETYSSGTSWYRVWSDGWCEQGGYSKENTTIALLKEYSTNSYNISLTRTSTEQYAFAPTVYSQSTDSFVFQVTSDLAGDSYAYWKTEGYIS